MFTRKRAVTNVLSLVIHCSDDNSVLLVFDEDRRDYWIPSTKIDETLSWKDNLHAFKKAIMEHEIVDEKLLRVYKIWTLEKDFLHLMFAINIAKDMKGKQTSLKGKIVWYSCSQISKLKSSLRSLEVLDITSNCQKKDEKNNGKNTGEIKSIGQLTEVGESDILVTDENCDNEGYLDVLKTIGFMPSGQNNLYEEYFLLTYPCIYMNHVAFKNIIKKFGNEFEYMSLFRAADVCNRGFITFKELLNLLAVMDAYTPHHGNFVEIRCQYIFRFYNKKQDGKLDYSSLHKLISDVLIERNSKIQITDLNNEVEVIIKNMGLKENSMITFEQFYSYVLQNKIPDTSVLLRFEQNYSEVPLPEGGNADSAVPNKIIFSLSRPPEQKRRHSDLDYAVVLKAVILKPGETAFQIRDLKLLEDAMTKSVAENFKILSNIKLLRESSEDLDSKIQEVIVALKYYATEISESPICCGECEFEEKLSFSWGSAYIENLGVTLLLMCDYLCEILQAEPRLLEIDPPVFIMGDLHGNFHDLMAFERTLWPNGIALTPTKLLFLGDYVDRGLSSLEVVMYLFAYKILCPNKLFLVRGNHEIREIQKLFTFQKECIYKFGNTLGLTVWKAVNDVFDRLPLAAVIDHKVFCCHGGIPPPWLCPYISFINSIPCPLNNCEKQSPLAWTLMWNDPLKTGGDLHRSQLALELIVTEGFVPNTQRGTAYSFSRDALDKFLQTNNLSYVVRAHEVVRTGFQVHQKGRLLTVFSTSGYCGGHNYAGSVLVSDKLLQVFMVNTEATAKESV